MRAVLLAAGAGKRLRSHFKRPKPLVHLLGLSLIERNILGLKECGIKEFVVITGCYIDEIRNSLGNGERLGVQIKYLHNSDWELGNGVSAFAFQKDYRSEKKFILLMADHIFEVPLLKRFVAKAQEISQEEILLAADKRVDKIFDLADGTKIKADQDYALELGKNLTEFNAVDCGLFIGSKALLEALEVSIDRGEYALTDAVNILAREGKVKLHFVEGIWEDVDDFASYKNAEKKFLQSLIPPKDGFISKKINRRFSLRITKILVRTRLLPNHVSFCSFLTALAAGICFAVSAPLWGGLLAQLSSILDGVDGEIARLKFLKSDFGGLFDALLDRYADSLLVIGMTYAWYVTSYNSLALLIGALALIGMPMSMLFKEKFQSLTGKPFIPEIYDGFLQYLPANRDGRMFIIMIGGILNLIPQTLILLAIMAHLQTWNRLYRARRI
ncbi:MAG: sugar phosphate nucleotidyltransferase [Desulfitobacteriia bacterium]|jgi:choline kinase/phosphatidylglycerophosphate synthase